MTATIATIWAMATSIPADLGVPTRVMQDRFEFLWLRRRKELEVVCGSQ